ncbi:MAG: hypothetical protein QOG15_3763, partial [Solirubrobacteraceae bacterium]|nr:hypothetical protein [Solirubrobacteraceae bacterium]
MNKPKKAKDALAAEQEPKRLSLDDPAVADIALEDFVLDGETMRADVSGAVLDVSLNRAMDGASTMVALVNDPAVGEPPRSKLLNSSLFQKAVDLDLDDLTFRLSDIDLASNDGGVELDLTFEARAVAILRTFTGAMHASRADKTRAEFIKSLCDEARIKFICPDLHVKQPIAQPAPSGGGTVGSGASDQGGNVFSVGDSLAVGTTGPLDAIVKRHISTDAATGRASAAGLAVLSAIAHLPQTLLVQLGTNDTSVPGFRSVVQAVKALPGVTQIYWVNIARTPLGGTTDADLNAVLRDEADDTLQILDWKHLVSAGTVSLGDGIHPDGAGYQKRAELISRALRIVPAATGSTAAPGSHAARQSRAPGLSKTANLKIKGKPATAAQLALIQIANGVAADFKAPALAQVAMNCAAIGESTYSTIINSLGYGGVFQGQVTTGGHYFKASDTAEQAKYFLLGGKGFGGGGA